MPLRAPIGRSTTNPNLDSTSLGKTAGARGRIETAARSSARNAENLIGGIGAVAVGFAEAREERQAELDRISDATAENEHRISLSELSTSLAVEASRLDLADPEVSKKFDQNIKDKFAGVKQPTVSSPEIQASLSRTRDFAAAQFRNNMTLVTEQAIVNKSMAGLDKTGVILSNEIRDGARTLSSGLEVLSEIVGKSELSPQAQSAQLQILRTEIIEQSILTDIAALRLDEAEATIDSTSYNEDLDPDKRDAMHAKVDLARKLEVERFEKVQSGHAQSIQDIIKFGQVTQPMLDAARKNDFISGHQWSTLSGNLRNFSSAAIAIQEKQELGAQYISGSLPMNPGNADQRSDVDSAFSAATAGRSEEEVLGAASAVARNIGYIPQPAEDVVHSLIARGSAEGWAEAARFQASTKAVSPAMWKGKYTEDESAIMSAMKRKLSLGIPAAQAANEVRTAMSVGDGERTSRTKTFRKSLDVVSLRETVTRIVNDPNSLSWFPWNSDTVDAASAIFSGRELLPREENAWPSLIPLSKFHEEKTDLFVPDAMMSDIIDRLEVETERLGPDMALEPAVETVLRKWAPTRIGVAEREVGISGFFGIKTEQRNFEWRAQSPELLYSAPGRDMDWFYNQKESTLLDAGVHQDDVDRVALVPDARTEFEGTYQIMLTPVNQPIFGEDGSVLRFAPNYEESPEGKADAAERKADKVRLRKASEMARQLDRAGDLSPGDEHALRLGLWTKEQLTDMERAGSRLMKLLGNLGDVSN